MRYYAKIEDLKNNVGSHRYDFNRSLEIARTKPRAIRPLDSVKHVRNYFKSVIWDMESDYEDLLLRWLHTRYPETRSMWLED